MTKEDLKDYRRILEKDYSNKDLEIETTLTYITIGALGFFLTINDKFLKLVTADYKFLLIISLSLLFAAFIMILVRKSKTIKYDYDLMTFLDGMEPNSENQDQKLLSMWDKTHMNLTLIQTIIYLGLVLGIGLQVLFMILNIR